MSIPISLESAPRTMEWRLDALCSQTDPELFFPDTTAESAAAKQICSDCDVRMDCLLWALTKGENHGIWGGLTHRERRSLLRQNQASEKQSRPRSPAVIAHEEIIFNRHLDGHSVPELAAHFEVTERTIYRIINRARQRRASASPRTPEFRVVEAV